MRIGRYEVVRKLATGGMAEVFLAKAAGPLGFEKSLVVKRILPHLVDEAGSVEMFLAEARLVAQLNHPHIVQIFDFGEADGAYFLAMEYSDGPNLRTLIHWAREAEMPLPPALCAKVAAWVCEGLAYAHELRDPATQHPLNLIHRDISPDNILVSRQGAVKIADFGIARVAGQHSQTQEGILKGKVTYMAPEYLKHQQLDRRADIYALGLVLYELLTGRRPFNATTEADVLHAVLFQPFIPAVERRPDLPEGLQHILARAIAKEPSERYPDCLTFQADLEQFILSRGESVGATHMARLITDLEAASPLRAHPVPPTAPAPQAPRFRDDPQTSPSLPLDATRRREKPLSASGNLPKDYEAIIGRQEELALLRQRFQEGARLVTILGPAGMGKTRLATHFGSTLLDSQQRWAGGVWLCVLTEASSAGDMCHVVGQALDVDLTHGDKEGDPAEQIGRALASRGQVLLILDNMEHLMRHASATLGRWMSLAPDARFLVTSREAMRLPDEWVLDLAPLRLPEDEEISLEAISRSEAVHLFVQRAQAAQGDFVLTAQDAPHVSEIVRRLDGIALAIELAAARTPVLGVAQIRERLSRRFELLRTGRRDASARQATLRGAIDWSWNLLEPAERQALAQCSVFRGGFTLEAAEAVLELPPDSPDVLDVIQSLRTKSLLRTAPTADFTGERRLALYESVREYASGRLSELGADAAVVARHADFFLSHARMLTRLLHGTSGVEALRKLSGERENLLAVCDNALAEQPVTPDSLARALAGLIALEPEVTARGPMDLTLERMDRALELAARIPVDERLRAEVFAIRGRAHLELGRLAAARKNLEEARKAFHSLGAAAQEKRALVELSMVARHEGDMNAAWDLIVEAEALPSGGDRWLDGYAVGNLGIFELYRSGATAAVPHLHAALEIFRGLGDATFGLVFLINYAFAIGELGRTREAVALLEEALSRSTLVRDRFRQAIARVNIGCLLLEDSRAAEAIEHLEAAVPTGRQLGSRILEACARGELGRAYLALGAPEKAQAHLREAIEALSEVSRWNMLRFSAHLAAVHAALGQLPAAQEGFRSLEAAPELREDHILSELVSLLRAAVDLAMARTESSPAQVEQYVAAARQRMERARRAPPAAASSDLRSSLRLLEQWLPAPG